MSSNFPNGITGIRDGQGLPPTWEITKNGDAKFNTVALSGGGTAGLILDNNEFLSGLTTTSIVKRLIGLNSSNVVSIDADAAGAVFAGTVGITGVLTATGGIASGFTIGATTVALVTFGASSVFGLDGAADILAVKNGTTAQEIRVYGTTTGPKYASLKHNGTDGVLLSQDGFLKIGGNNSATWEITSGEFRPVSDNTEPVGAAARRATNIFSVLATFGQATNRTGTIYAGTDSDSSVVLDSAASAALGAIVNLRKANGSQAARTIVANNDLIGGINAFGLATTGPTYQPAAQILFKIDGTPGAGTDMPGRIEFWTTPDGSATPLRRMFIDNAGLIQVGANGGQLNAVTAAFGAGTAYSFTDTAAAVAFGTTSPAIVIPAAGTYRISGQLLIAYTGATVVAETATIKIRRTNNTAADLSAVVVLDLPVATTLTNTYGIFAIPPFTYTTSATDDAVTIFANVSAALGAGTIDATAIGTSISAQRLS